MRRALLALIAALLLAAPARADVYPAGKRGRVYARAFYTRKGSKRVHRKTAWRHFVMCG